jgi:dephospho-CoA kinase
MHKPIIAVAGKQGAGKDEFIDFLAHELGPSWVVHSTSDVLTQILADRIDLPVWEVRNNKQFHRPQLQRLGDELELQEPALLAKMALMSLGTEEGIIFESVRRASEIWYLEKRNATFILIEANRKVREERRGGLVGEGHTTENEAYEILKKKPGVKIIDNNGSLEDLELQAVQVALDLVEY